MALAQGGAMVHQEVGAGALRDVGGAMRGDATTSQGKRGDRTTRRHVERQRHIKRLQRNEMPCDNQTGKWEATAHKEVVTHQEVERLRDYRQHNN